MNTNPITETVLEKCQAISVKDIGRKAKVTGLLIEHGKRIESDRARLIAIAHAFIKAAHDDKVEDFSAVSNAADRATAELRELETNPD